MKRYLVVAFWGGSLDGQELLLREPIKKDYWCKATREYYVASDAPYQTVTDTEVDHHARKNGWPFDTALYALTEKLTRQQFRYRGSYK